MCALIDFKEFFTILVCVHNDIVLKNWIEIAYHFIIEIDIIFW